MCVHVSKYVSVFVSSMLVQPRGLPIANRFVDRGAVLCSLWLFNWLTAHCWAYVCVCAFAWVWVLVVNMSKLSAGLQQNVFRGGGSVLRRGLEGMRAREIGGGERAWQRDSDGQRRENVFHQRERERDKRIGSETEKRIMEWKWGKQKWY